MLRASLSSTGLSFASEFIALIMKRDALWWDVISSKFGGEGGWCSRAFRGAYGCEVWKEIRKEWEIVASHVIFSLGNGRRLRF